MITFKLGDKTYEFSQINELLKLNLEVLGIITASQKIKLGANQKGKKVILHRKIRQAVTEQLIQFIKTSKDLVYTLTDCKIVNNISVYVSYINEAKIQKHSFYILNCNSIKIVFKLKYTDLQQNEKTASIKKIVFFNSKNKNFESYI
jgi:hypothetical protein